MDFVKGECFFKAILPCMKDNIVYAQIKMGCTWFPKTDSEVRSCLRLKTNLFWVYMSDIAAAERSDPGMGDRYIDYAFWTAFFCDVITGDNQCALLS